MLNETLNITLSYAPMMVVASIFIIGFFGTFLPVLPGNFIIWLGIVIHKLWLGESSVSWSVVIITGILTLVAFALDYLCTYWGARRFGASWRGGIGALIGGILGLFIPPPLFWIIVGPIIGAIIAELLGGRSTKDAGRAGVGTIVGGLLSFALKIGIATFSIIWFYISIPVIPK
jgi:uncharacterized protein